MLAAIAEFTLDLVRSVFLWLVLFPVVWLVAAPFILLLALFRTGPYSMDVSSMFIAVNRFWDDWGIAIVP